jgi:hypothetical protein
VSAEGLFSLASALVLPGWALMLLAPRWRLTERITNACVLPLALSAAYLALVAARFFVSEGGYGSLAEVRRLFEDPYLLLAGWIHYLAFDLFVGGWELRDARRLGLPHLLVAPCLVLTFLFGPVGLLAYWALRAGWRRRFVAGE